MHAANIAYTVARCAKLVGYNTYHTMTPSRVNAKVLLQDTLD